PICGFPDGGGNRHETLQQLLPQSDIRPSEEVIVDPQHGLYRERSRFNLDHAFLVHERAVGTGRSSDWRPQTLLAMQPARIPATRLAPSDVVPEAIDRPRKLERLGAQRGAGRRFVQFKTKKPRLRVRQIDITTSPARTLRRVQGPPTPTLQGPAQTKARFGCSVPPIYDQPTEPARFGK